MVVFFGNYFKHWLIISFNIVLYNLYTIKARLIGTLLLLIGSLHFIHEAYKHSRLHIQNMQTK